MPLSSRTLRLAEWGGGDGNGATYQNPRTGSAALPGILPRTLCSPSKYSFFPWYGSGIQNCPYQDAGIKSPLYRAASYRLLYSALHGCFSHISWFGRHEGRSDTVGGARGRPESSKEARETGDVKTGREGTAGRAKARKGDWAATWVPRQARNKTRDNNFRIPPPAHDVGGKDAEASRLSGARQGKARQRSYARDSG